MPLRGTWRMLVNASLVNKTWCYGKLNQRNNNPSKVSTARILVGLDFLWIYVFSKTKSV
jgi:hypothetical protein